MCTGTSREASAPAPEHTGRECARACTTDIYSIVHGHIMTQLGNKPSRVEWMRMMVYLCHGIHRATSNNKQASVSVRGLNMIVRRKPDAEKHRDRVWGGCQNGFLGGGWHAGIWVCLSLHLLTKMFVYNCAYFLCVILQ